MKFITDYLSLIIKKKSYYTDRDTLKLIELLSESKLAILDSDGHCELIGDWIEEEGVYYSNESYSAKYAELSRCFLPYGYGFYDKDIASRYDEETGLYNFDENDCPFCQYGDMDYCGLCTNYPCDNI